MKQRNSIKQQQQQRQISQREQRQRELLKNQNQNILMVKHIKSNKKRIKATHREKNQIMTGSVSQAQADFNKFIEEKPIDSKQRTKAKLKHNQQTFAQIYQNSVKNNQLSIECDDPIKKKYIISQARSQFAGNMVKGINNYSNSILNSIPTKRPIISQFKLNSNHIPSHVIQAMGRRQSSMPNKNKISNNLVKTNEIKKRLYL